MSTAAVTSREVLTQRREVLARGPINWSDADIDQIAAFTSMTPEELASMRHKMVRAREFSEANIRALDDLVADSPDATTLRPRIEGHLSLRDALRTAETFTGLFLPVKAALDELDAELARPRPSGWRRLLRR